MRSSLPILLISRRSKARRSLVTCGLGFVALVAGLGLRQTVIGDEIPFRKRDPVIISAVTPSPRPCLAGSWTPFTQASVRPSKSVCCSDVARRRSMTGKRRLVPVAEGGLTAPSNVTRFRACGRVAAAYAAHAAARAEGPAKAGTPTGLRRAVGVPALAGPGFWT